MFFYVTQKHKSCHQYEDPVIWVVIVEPFHRPSTLLHLIGSVIGRSAVSHGWTLMTLFASQDHYALSNYKRQRKSKLKYVLVHSK